MIFYTIGIIGMMLIADKLISYDKEAHQKFSSLPDQGKLLVRILMSIFWPLIIVNVFTEVIRITYRKIAHSKER